MVRAAKKTPSEHFEGLDMITKLLAPVPPKGNAAGPLIEVLNNGNYHVNYYIIL